jgi:hypothetical protein
LLTIAGGIILAIIIIVVGVLLIGGMFSGFKRSKAAGCTTMVVFGVLLLIFGDVCVRMITACG